MIFLMSTMALTACGAAPTGRSTMPLDEVTPMGMNARPVIASAAPIADPTLPDKQLNLSAEVAFASTK
jgi:hypothetical protein